METNYGTAEKTQGSRHVVIIFSFFCCCFCNDTRAQEHQFQEASRSVQWYALIGLTEGR